MATFPPSLRIVPLRDVRSTQASTPPSAIGPARDCVPCNVCCNGWLRTEVLGQTLSPARGGCQHVGSRGCTVHDLRPLHPCRSFFCGWVAESSPLPDWMRPDRSHVIVLFNKTTWAGRPVDVAIPVGRRIKRKALEYLKRLAEQTNRPLLFAENAAANSAGPLSDQLTYFAWGPPDFQREFARRLADGEPLWPETTPIAEAPVGETGWHDVARVSAGTRPLHQPAAEHTP